MDRQSFEPFVGLLTKDLQMNDRNTAVHETAERLARVVADALCTRTLGGFAEEARLDGETLRDAIERYEVDYAWHVLGSQRMRDETVALLEARLARPATDEQKACVADTLQLAASGQASELLMSFDNDVPAQLAAALSEAWAVSQQAVMPSLAGAV
jgi:hypothetical protein